MRQYKQHSTEEVEDLGINFYHTSEWRHKRSEILRRDHYECVRCRDVHHRIKLASTVHHVQHLDEHPELALSDDNLVSLCESCHNEVHPEKFEAIERKEKYDDEKW